MKNFSTKKETFKIDIKWTDKIQDIMNNIAEKKNCPQSLQKLYLGNGEWDNEAKLEIKESLVDKRISKLIFKTGLSLMLSGVVSVYDDVTDGEEYFDLKFEAFETIKELKTKIQIMRNKHSKFFHGYKDSALYTFDVESQVFHKLNDDNRPLYDIGLKNFIMGNYIWSKNPDHFRSPLQLFVKTLTGKTINISIGYFETIERLKVKIKDKEGLHTYQQRILFNSKMCSDEKTLAFYKIKKESTCHLILRTKL